MNERKFKLAVCQIRTELSPEETMAKAGRMVRGAAENGAQVVCLPEMFSCPYSKEFFKKYAHRDHAGYVAAMSGWARECGIVLVGGSIPENENGRTYNTCFVFDRTGAVIAKHRKVHLFDVDVPGVRFRESATFTPGSEVTVFDTEYGRMGAAVCYDVRFPELFRAMAVRGAELIILPAQFNMFTGPKHWELALRSRAVDNELFMVGAAAARYEGFDYECWGHSAVVDPYGDVIASCDEKEGTVYADIDLDRVGEVRRCLPTFMRLRRDVYSVAE